MSGVMLNFKGKMYKLCEQKDMDRKPKSKPVEVERKIRSDKGGTHAKPKPKPAPAKKDVKRVLAKVKKNIAKAPAKKAPVKQRKTRSDKGGTHSDQKYKVLPSGRRVKRKDGKTAKQLKVEGFPAFKGDEPRAKEEKRRENKLY